MRVKHHSTHLKNGTVVERIVDVLHIGGVDNKRFLHFTYKKPIFILKMKRKRDLEGYSKDELLLQTTTLNLSYNRCFNIPHNILIYDLVKDKDLEYIYEVNQIVEDCIEKEKYMELEDIKRLVYKVKVNT